MAIKKTLSSSEMIAMVAMKIETRRDLASFASVNHTVFRNSIGYLWEEVRDVTQFAYLFPSLEVICVEERVREFGENIVSPYL